jgi:Flp pilus assembly pilin Flp
MKYAPTFLFSETKALKGRCMKSASADFMKWNDQRGTAMVEFALIAPLLFVVLFGIIEFGILLYDKAMITNASREGARAGIVYYFVPDLPPRISDAEIEQVVRNYCEQHLISFEANSPLGIQIERGVRTYPSGLTDDILSVTLDYPFHFLVFSNVLALIGGERGNNLINLTAETVMRLE